MQVSILIVTKNRPKDLVFTLSKLYDLIDLSKHEVLVFIDGCSITENLVKDYTWVVWDVSKKSIGASPARNQLYKKAKGDYYIGFDDDAHPLSLDFIPKTISLFEENKNTAILAYEEVKGVYESDKEAIKDTNTIPIHYFTNDFVGCGFAIRSAAYNKTAGFPIWMDIYGEESCVAVAVMDLGYEILFDNSIKVNHRVDRSKRIQQGKNYLRFEKQLKNSINYFLVYYPAPFLKILKLLFHNFKKYGLSDLRFFWLFWKSLFSAMANLPNTLKFRRPVKNETLKRIRELKSLQY